MAKSSLKKLINDKEKACLAILAANINQSDYLDIANYCDNYGLEMNDISK